MWLGESLTALCLAIAVNAVIAPMVLPNRAVGRFAIVAVVFGVCLIGWLRAAHATGIETIAGLLVYAGGCELYVFLFTLAMASISANIMWRLGVKPMSDQQLHELYDSTAMVKLRIARLTEKGLLLSSREGVLVTPQGRRLAHGFALLRALMGRQ